MMNKMEDRCASNILTQSMPIDGNIHEIQSSKTKKSLEVMNDDNSKMNSDFLNGEMAPSLRRSQRTKIENTIVNQFQPPTTLNPLESLKKIKTDAKITITSPKKTVSEAKKKIVEKNLKKIPLKFKPPMKSPNNLKISKTTSLTDPNNKSLKLSNKNKKKSTINGSETIRYYDPTISIKNEYELVEFSHFTEKNAPFFIKVKLDALALMDLHAHCLRTECIGCLGGHYCRITRTLRILVAEPVKSIDDRQTACEMDAASFLQAVQKFESQNIKVVGWYHSHPTFSPHPSILDLMTQALHQSVFGDNQSICKYDHNRSDEANHNKNDEENGALINCDPFIGFIISPYMETSLDKTKLSEKSFKQFCPLPYRPGMSFYANDKMYKYDRSNSNYRLFTMQMNSTLASRIKCFWVGNWRHSEMSLSPKLDHVLVPYELNVSWFREENLIPSVTNRLSEMCKWLSKEYMSSLVKFAKSFTRVGSINVTYFEALIASLSYNLQNESVWHLLTDEEGERIRRECITILIEDLVSQQFP